QTVTVDPNAASYGLDLSAAVHVLTNPSFGVQQLQVLVDGQVAWEVNPSTLHLDSYLPFHADLTPYLRGKTSANLTLRLVTIQSPQVFSADVVVDDLVPTGFQIANPGFEDRSAWTLARNNVAFVPDFDLSDPARGREVFNVVQAQYGPHSLVIR